MFLKLATKQIRLKRGDPHSDLLALIAVGTGGRGTRHGGTGRSHAPPPLADLSKAE
jgi:hypothetical protein